MRMLVRLLVILGVVIVAVPTPAYANGGPGYVDGVDGSVLLINQSSPDYPQMSHVNGLYIQQLLGHFTSHVEVTSESSYVSGQESQHDRVVVLGNNYSEPLPQVILDDLADTQRPVLWLGNGVDYLPVDMETEYGFVPGDYTNKDVPKWVEYQGSRYPAAMERYHPVEITSSSTQVLASFDGPAGRTPYIVRGNNVWFVNGIPVITSDNPDRSMDAPSLVFADVLHEFFGSTVTDARKAVIRFEDVSVHINPDLIIAAVDYLHSQGIPFAMGVIPAQRFSDGSIVSLREKPEFVQALRYARDHGGTILLHGYHHTFGTGEDWEYWDIERNAPLEGESWDMYAREVEDGIRILRNVGLEPHMWETPHYKGSPLAYDVFTSYFSHAFERRAPLSWMPYPGGPDAHGQVLIPENLGYIAPSDGKTVDLQLERAELLQIVRDSWAVGFFHPVTVAVDDVARLTTGLQQQGYTFVDLQDVSTDVRFGYQPGRWERFLTWFLVDVNPRPVHLAWGMGAMGVLFLVRLPAQWRDVDVQPPRKSGGARSPSTRVPVQ